MMLCLAITTATAWAQDPIPAYLSQVSITNLFNVASNLVTRYGPRRADTYDHFLNGSCTWSGVPYTNTTIEMSANYAKSLFEAMGYTPTMENVPYGYSSYGHNVYVTKTGSAYPNVYIEFGGHMDTQPTTPGGCDNASGSTTIIELARVLKNYPNRYSMRFALWVGEEISVPGPGCYYHVQQALARGEKIKAGLNVDGTGWPEVPNPDGTPNYNVELWYNDAESSRISDLFGSVRTQYNVAIGFRKNAATTTSDERGYWYSGQTAVTSVGGSPTYAPNFHGCGDTVTNMNFTNIFRAAQLNLAVGLKLDAEVMPPSITLVVSPSSIPADGASTSTATATVRDSSGNRLVGETVVFSTSGDVTFGSVTNQGDGTYQVTVTASTTPGEEIITATDSGVSATASLSETISCSGSCFTDTTAADFSTGTLGNGTYVAQTYDGEVILAPTLGAEFIDTALPPAGWTLAPYNCADGTATVQDGQISLNCTLLASSVAYGPGHSLEFKATYVAGNPYQGAGFWRYYTSPWRGLDLGSGGNALQANTSVGTPVLISGNPIGSPHRYRIDWTSSGFTFWVDGTQVATEPGTAGGETMNVGLADFAWNTSDTQNFRVDWVRMTPYAASGTFHSRVFDAGQAVTWHTLGWSADTPAGTSLALSYQTGNTPTPDGTWTSFTPVSASGGALTGNSRYIRYAAQLATSDTTQTPVLKDVTVSYSLCAPPAITNNPSSATRCEGGSVTFSVTATGSGLTYQWRKDGTNIDGATASSYTNASVGTGDAGWYDVVVSGTCGSPATSSPATLMVNPAPVGGTATPAAAALCSGTGTTITLTGQTGSIIKWQSSTDGNNWSDIASTADALASGPLMAATRFRAVVGSGVCSVAISSAALVSINAVTVGGIATPASSSIYSGGNTTINLSGEVGTLLKWQSSADGNNWSDIASTANPLPTGTLTQTTEYQAVVQSGVCGTANSSVATVNVNALVAPSLTGALILNATTIQLTFSGPQGQSYEVLESSDLLQPVSRWNVLTTGTFGAGAATYNDTNATDQARFYRITSP